MNMIHEQNKREYPHAHQKQLMKETRAANMVPPNNGSNDQQEFHIVSYKPILNVCMHDCSYVIFIGKNAEQTCLEG